MARKAKLQGATLFAVTAQELRVGSWRDVEAVGVFRADSAESAIKGAKRQKRRQGWHPKDAALRFLAARVN